MQDLKLIYRDDYIGKKEFFISVPSMIIGVGVLSLSNTIVDEVPFSDGWISIFIAGFIASIGAFFMMKVTTQFPRTTFYDYCRKITGKPMAIILTMYIFIHFIIFTSYEVRSIASISKQYILGKTPFEIISVVFLLLIVYAVSGSRSALIRLNLLFFPIALIILVVLLIFCIPFLEWGNLKPFFKANPFSIFQGAKQSILSFVGFEILLFYTALLPKDDLNGVVKLPIIGLGLVTIVYMLVFLFSIAVFSVEGTKEVVYPLLELTKQVEIPGGIIERFDPIFFTVWVMTIFNTSAMAYDVTLIACSSLFKKVKKMTWICALTPFIYLLQMLPLNIIQIRKVGTFLGYSGLVLGLFLPICLYLIARIRGVKG